MIHYGCEIIAFGGLYYVLNKNTSALQKVLEETLKRLDMVEKKVANIIAFLETGRQPQIQSAPQTPKAQKVQKSKKGCEGDVCPVKRKGKGKIKEESEESSEEEEETEDISMEVARTIQEDT